jgi:Flp pilus assembly protein TadG
MRPRRVLTRFRKDAKGATAIEFGLLAMPFFMMLMMIAMIIVSSPLPSP